MKIKDKIMFNNKELTEFGPINVVIFGDSVSHGGMTDYIDYENVYWNVLKKKLNQFRDYVPVNMINASIGGTTAAESVARLERQALIHEPDLVIVSFGLNDVNRDLGEYLNSLEYIFNKCLSAGHDVIFLTPNMLNTYVADDTDPKHLNYARRMADIQNSGRMDEFMAAAIALAERCGVTVCDCYSEWKKLAETQDTTLLLANRINHPSAEMHKLFAEKLYEIIMPSEGNATESDSTMYEE